MKVTIRKVAEVEAKELRISAGVRYWEDSKINGDNIPCIDLGRWCPIIDIDSGKITNWEIGKIASIHYKVCDDLGYSIFDQHKNIIYYVDEAYVPDILCPKQEGHGDYIIMDIDENGFIQDWEKELIHKLIKDDD